MKLAAAIATMLLLTVTQLAEAAPVVTTLETSFGMRSR
jgi:hypothetical protein